MATRGLRAECWQAASYKVSALLLFCSLQPSTLVCLDFCFIRIRVPHLQFVSSRYRLPFVFRQCVEAMAYLFAVQRVLKNLCGKAIGCCSPHLTRHHTAGYLASTCFAQLSSPCANGDTPSNLCTPARDGRTYVSCSVCDSRGHSDPNRDLSSCEARCVCIVCMPFRCGKLPVVGRGRASGNARCGA